MTIKKTDDYVERMHKKFPEVSQRDLKKILNYCWKMIYLYNTRGLDTLVKYPDLIFYIGKLRNSSLDHFKYYIHKLKKRIRYMFQRTKSEWDGYYYFTLTENQYLNYLKQGNRKIKTFKNVVAFKLLEECKVSEWRKKYIFRYKDTITSKYTKYYPELKLKDAELIIQRDPLNMQDLMVSMNKYKYIQ